MKLPNLSRKFATHVLRIVMGGIVCSHGIARIFFHSVPDFGEFLNSKGLVIGTVLAWMITLGEIVAGILLAVGYRVKYCVIFQAIVILFGIIMVHAPHGWFVVGHGTNGIEYSILIFAVLLYLYSTDNRK